MSPPYPNRCILGFNSPLFKRIIPKKHTRPSPHQRQRLPLARPAIITITTTTTITTTITSIIRTTTVMPVVPLRPTGRATASTTGRDRFSFESSSHRVQVPRIHSNEFDFYFDISKISLSNQVFLLPLNYLFKLIKHLMYIGR